MYQVHVLKNGYSEIEAQGKKACGTITLVKGKKNIIVDTGNPWDKQTIIDGLKLHDLVPEKIDYVVCTHGHSDHVGNLNLFLNAIHIISHDICIGDTYVLHDFKQGIPYEIDDDVEVISTPGHTSCDVSVNVQTDKGQVCIAGDLFERLEDMEDYTLWQDNSENPALQHKVRLEVLKRADWIVPGHGPMFQVPNEFKQQPRMVMYESVTQEADGMTCHSESYTVIEEN
ncbi:metallo-beta-lactamase domain-containing protein 1-like [Mya arenaria]|uniref:metallo-beta-lactamase domain-containing protein 1-like n=1 Tax=Mya arenaria TaxID=6604 RepID=UPI0022E044E4|nr:metallo-beta-lactamase domain-containing protein 1-like [Mya arenaria]